MWTVIAFSESQDPAGAYVNVAAVPDRHVTVSGDSIFVPSYNHLVGAMACMGATVPGQPRLVSPSLRRINPFYIQPVEHDIHPGAALHYDVDPNRAIPLDINEALEANDNSNPAAAEQHTIVVVLADGQIVPITGNIRTVRFQITLAHVVNSWEHSEMTLIDDLPVGQYDVVGAGVIADGGVAFRFVPLGAGHRPGGPCSVLNEDSDQDVFRYGRLGVWLTFDQQNLPGVELLGSAAVGSATYEGFFDIIPR